MLFSPSFHTSSCFSKYRNSPHSHLHDWYSSPRCSVCPTCLCQLASSQDNKPEDCKAFPRPKRELAILYFLSSSKHRVLALHRKLSSCTHAHTSLSLIHLTSTKASWYQADMQYIRLKTPVLAPTYSAEAHYHTMGLLDRKVCSNSMLSICTFPWTMKSIAIPFNT